MQGFDVTKGYTMGERYLIGGGRIASEADAMAYYESIVEWERIVGKVSRATAEEVVSINLRYFAGKFSYGG